MAVIHETPAPPGDEANREGAGEAPEAAPAEPVVYPHSLVVSPPDQDVAYTIKLLFAKIPSAELTNPPPRL